MNGDIRAGAIDVHAHWLPRDLLALPPGSPLGGMHDRDGELFLGDVPLSFPTAAMTDIDAVVADTLKAGLGARVISAPPFAFPVPPRRTPMSPPSTSSSPTPCPARTDCINPRCRLPASVLRRSGPGAGRGATRSRR